jgi:hypothetical protein
MKTEDIQQWLATDPEIQQLVQERVGMLPDGTWEEDDIDPEMKSWVDRAKNPKMWVRRTKMKIDSPAWKNQSPMSAKDFGITGVDVSGAITREFWLRDTDHITILTFEKDEKIVLIEDYSD